MNIWRTACREVAAAGRSFRYDLRRPSRRSGADGGGAVDGAYEAYTRRQPRRSRAAAGVALLAATAAAATYFGVVGGLSALFADESPGPGALPPAPAGVTPESAPGASLPRAAAPERTTPPVPPGPPGPPGAPPPAVPPAGEPTGPAAPVPPAGGPSRSPVPEATVPGPCSCTSRPTVPPTGPPTPTPSPTGSVIPGPSPSPSSAPQPTAPPCKEAKGSRTVAEPCDSAGSIAGAAGDQP